jgi:hypothetical protein
MTTRHDVLARLGRVEQRLVMLEALVCGRPTIAELREEVVRRLQAAKEAGNLTECRKFQKMLDRAAALDGGTSF